MSFSRKAFTESPKDGMAAHGLRKEEGDVHKIIRFILLFAQLQAEADLGRPTRLSLTLGSWSKFHA